MPLFGHQCRHHLCLVNSDLFDTVVHSSVLLTLDELNSLCLWKLHLNGKKITRFSLLKVVFVGFYFGLSTYHIQMNNSALRIVEIPDKG